MGQDHQIGQPNVQDALYKPCKLCPACFRLRTKISCKTAYQKLPWLHRKASAQFRYGNPRCLSYVRYDHLDSKWTLFLQQRLGRQVKSWGKAQLMGFMGKG